jgi:hypothetical protein
MAKPSMTSGLFAPLPNRAESKASTTDAAFRSIVSAEAAAREAKTERLRRARLKHEAETEPAPAPKKRAARKTGKPR